MSNNKTVRFPLSFWDGGGEGGCGAVDRVGEEGRGGDCCDRREEEEMVDEEGKE